MNIVRYKVHTIPRGLVWDLNPISNSLTTEESPLAKFQQECKAQQGQVEAIPAGMPAASNAAACGEDPVYAAACRMAEEAQAAELEDGPEL